MAFFDTSSTPTTQQSLIGIDPNQITVTPTTTPVAPQISQSIVPIISAPSSTTDPLAVLTAPVNNYLKAAIQSTTATFDTSLKSLAATISPSLSGIFTNTNNPKNSTTTTLISDPVKTNLLDKKNPASGTFNISSLLSGSSPISTAGATSLFGTGASSMQGTTFSTLLNRLNLDISAAASLPNALVNNSSSNKLNGLFSTLSVDAGSLTGSAVSSLTGSTSLGGLVAGVTTGVTASSLGVASSPIVTRAIGNDLAVFLGTTNNVTTALGNKSGSSALSSYFVTNPSSSLINSITGQTVNTNGSGVDATTANAIAQTILKTGCVTSVTNYSSSSVQASSFNLSLEQAALNGLADLVGGLLGCSHATTLTGQTSLGSAFTSSTNSQINIASQILASVQSPATLNTPTVTSNILSNPNLTANDVGTVNSIFNTFGTSTQKAYTDPSSSSINYPVYDVSLFSQSQPSFLDATFNSNDFTNFLGGTPMTVGSDGTLNLALV